VCYRFLPEAGVGEFFCPRQIMKVVVDPQTRQKILNQLKAPWHFVGQTRF